MQAKQQYELDALHRVKSFLDTNTGALGAVNGTPARASFDGVLTTLVDHVAVQDSAEKNATSRTKAKDVQREVLRLQHMQPIAAIARTRLADMPAIVDLRLPDRSVSDGRLVSAGHGMVKAATPYKQVFIDAMVPSDFLEALQSAADSLRQAVTARDMSRVELHQATTGVQNELVRARAVVRILNAFVVQALKDQPELLAGWVMAKRVVAKPGVPRGTVKVPAVATPAAPAPVASAPAAPEEVHPSA